MSDHDRPLPRPPKTPFGKQRSSPEQGGQELLADRMAAAAAEGRLDEFLKEEMPDSDHAQALAKMMMGMTGMLPGIGMAAPAPPAAPSASNDAPAAAVPESVLKAVQDGDVKGLMDMLRQEHQKRSPDSQIEGTIPAAAPAAQEPSSQPTIDKEMIDALIRISTDNSVSLDWIILRAIKVYVEEYGKTGKL